MNAATMSVLTFTVVTASTFLTALLLLRRWPVIERDRLKAGGPDPRTASILRFENEIGPRWQRVAERLELLDVRHVHRRGNDARPVDIRCP